MGISPVTTNPLLVKDSVGKTRPTVFDLPGNDHIYGKKVERNPEECAAQVLQHWNVKATSKHAVPALDYITMNRNTAKQGILSPHEIRRYRKEHPVRMRIGDHNLFGSDSGGGGLKNENGEPLTSTEARKLKLLGSLPHDNDPNFVYGMPTRPSTPVAYLMTDKYQREWIAGEAKRNLTIAQQQKDRLKKNIQTSPAAVRNQQKNEKVNKRVLIVDKDPKTLFKISKFLKQGPKISSWRRNEQTLAAGGDASVVAAPAPAAGKNLRKELAEAAEGIRNLQLDNISSGGAQPSKSSPAKAAAAAAAAEDAPPKVRFADDVAPVQLVSKQQKDNAELPQMPQKKLIAVPGAAPDGWKP
ncbi:hypothetical protein HDU82_000618, partial [Entophlyctis luteolus]